MTPDIPKGPESDLRQRIQDAIEDACTGQDDANGGTVYFLDGPRMPAELADVLMSVVAPEVERLTAEVELLRSDVAFEKSQLANRTRDRDELLQECMAVRQSMIDAGYVQSGRDETADAVAAACREVSRLREQLAARPTEVQWKDAQSEIERLEENESFLESAVHVACGCCDGSYSGMDNCLGLAVPRLYGRVRTMLRGGSSSEVEAPRPAQHKVAVSQGGHGTSSAYCYSCKKFMTGSDQEMEDWKDQHEADTLVPQTEEEEDRVPTLAALRSQRRRYTRVKGRPSDSERLAPQSDEDVRGTCGKAECLRFHPPVYPADLFERTDGRFVCVCGDLVAERQAHLDGGYRWGCIERDCSAHSREDAAQAARSEATPEVDPDAFGVAGYLLTPPSPSLPKEGEDSDDR